MKHATALVIRSKAPRPGGTKTRLSPPLTPQEAAGLYRALLLDTLARAAGLGLRAALTPEWYDVDTGEDLACLIAELENLPSRRLIHTRAFMKAAAWTIACLEWLRCVIHKT
jgi:glycosyltransferase A (GT-A) superfamily protein (DUF2064 family)